MIWENEWMDRWGERLAEFKLTIEHLLDDIPEIPSNINEHLIFADMKTMTVDFIKEECERIIKEEYNKIENMY